MLTETETLGGTRLKPNPLSASGEQELLDFYWVDSSL